MKELMYSAKEALVAMGWSILITIGISVVMALPFLGIYHVVLFLVGDQLLATMVGFTFCAGFCGITYANYISNHMRKKLREEKAKKGLDNGQEI